MRTFVTISLVLLTAASFFIAGDCPTAHAQNHQDDPRISRAEALLREGQFAEAAKLYEEILKRQPTFHEAHFALGVSYSQTGRPKEAETNFKKYLSLQPLSADGHAALGILLLQQNRHVEAKPILERSLQLDPNFLEARKALGRVHF